MKAYALQPNFTKVQEPAEFPNPTPRGDLSPFFLCNTSCPQFCTRGWQVYWLLQLGTCPQINLLQNDSPSCQLLSIFPPSSNGSLQILLSNNTSSPMCLHFASNKSTQYSSDQDKLPCTTSKPATVDDSIKFEQEPHPLNLFFLSFLSFI